jgi:hypothetical protein
VRRLLLVVLVVLAACGGNDGGTQAITTSTSTTATTAPDPAVAGCRTAKEENPIDAIDQLVISRDERIVTAAKELERTTTGFDLDLAAQTRAVTEVVRACEAAGYWPP